METKRLDSLCVNSHPETTLMRMAIGTYEYWHLVAATRLSTMIHRSYDGDPFISSDPHHAFRYLLTIRAIWLLLTILIFIIFPTICFPLCTMNGLTFNNLLHLNFRSTNAMGNRGPIPLASQAALGEHEDGGNPGATRHLMQR